MQRVYDKQPAHGLWTDDLDMNLWTDNPHINYGQTRCIRLMDRQPQHELMVRQPIHQLPDRQPMDKIMGMYMAY